MALMSGGLQVQALEICQAINAAGGDFTAALFDWSLPGPLPDLYHFVGFQPHFYALTGLIRASGRPYVITHLFGNTGGRGGLLAAAARQFLKAHVLRERSRLEAVTRASALITLNESDARAARFIYRVPSGRIQVVPNGMSEIFFNPPSQPWIEKYGDKPFVLCVGAVQPRKNQLLALEVCNQLRLPLVLIGPVLPGNEVYGGQVRQAAAANATFGGHWLTSLKNTDPLLHAAYAMARLVILLSREETQPLSIMQAMAGRKPTLLLDAPYARDPMFQQAHRAASADPGAISEAMRLAWENPRPTALSTEYQWSKVAARLQAIYESVCVDASPSSAARELHP